MIALPFHPSNAYTIRELQENPADILQADVEEANEQLDSGNAPLHLTGQDPATASSMWIRASSPAAPAAPLREPGARRPTILRGKSIGNGEFALNVYPAIHARLHGAA